MRGEWTLAEVAGHRCYTDGATTLPSVTEILRRTQAESYGLRKWKRDLGPDGVRTVLDIACARGKRIDAWAERYMLAGHEPDESTSGWWRSIRPALAQLRLHASDIVTQRTVADTLGGWVGTLDIRCMLAGRWTVLDVKSASKPKRAREVEDMLLQATAYALASRYQDGIDCSDVCVIVALADRAAQVFADRVECTEQRWLERVESYWQTHAPKELWT